MSQSILSSTPNYKYRTPTKSFIYSLGETSHRSSSQVKKYSSPNGNSAKKLFVGQISKFQAEMAQMQKQLVVNKEKLCSCLEIFEMLESNGQHQRCLLHNNIFSLYCQHQRRILCVSCLYSLHKHRSHKVIPLKDCIDQIYEENKNLATQIGQQIKNLSLYEKIAEQNSKAVSIYMNGILLNVERQYTNQIKQINKKFQNYKQLIKDSFYPLIVRCKDTKKLIEQFKCNTIKAFNVYNNNQSNEQIIEDAQIMKQVLYATILELCQFKNREITKTQLDTMFRKIQPSLMNF